MIDTLYISWFPLQNFISEHTKKLNQQINAKCFTKMINAVLAIKKQYCFTALDGSCGLRIFFENHNCIGKECYVI